jgi:AcrR family transcriptional regulator
MATPADERQNKEKQDHDGGDDRGNLHPARCAGYRPEISPLTRAIVGAGTARRIFHTRALLCSAISYRPQFTIHSVLYQTQCLGSTVAYTWMMPRLWHETIEAHRRGVREAILDAAAALAAERGPMSVTMSGIAGEAGVGRATLYKYFPDVESILIAWHERQVAGHLEHLTEVRDRAGEDGGGAGQRLAAVLEAYALISREHPRDELAAFVHRGEHVVRAQERLRGMIQDLLAEGAESGDFRKDVAPGELAGYCLHAVAAAGGMPSEAAVRRLVVVTLDGLRPRP